MEVGGISGEILDADWKLVFFFTFARRLHGAAPLGLLERFSLGPASPSSESDTSGYDGIMA
jgi:hypothetical protein